MVAKKVIVLLLGTVLLGLMAACGQALPQTVTVIETVVVEKEVQGETITVVETVEVEKVVEKVVEVMADDPDAGRLRLRTVIGSEPPSLDPSLATDTTSVFFISNMFVGLTAFDSQANVIPSLAEAWSVSADGLEWSFSLRDDIEWVNRDPNTGEYTAIRPVTAQDVVYGVIRTLDPNTGSDYAYVLYAIAGAEAFNTVDPNAADFAEVMAAVGVAAPDDQTVVFTLGAPAAYFPSIAGMWVTYPQPQEAIEQWGDNWTEAGLIVTNGPYTLREWTHGASIMIEKNPLWVNAAEVQIELFGGPIIQEASTAMAMYENNELDMMASPGWGPPLPDMDRIRADAQLSQELFIAPQLCTYYYGFVNTKPPFDDVRVRKAFQMTIDRESLIENVIKGGQTAAHSFAPPGIFGNVADNFEIGASLVGVDSYAERVSEAQGLLAEAGYPEGEGLEVTLGHNTSESHAQIAQVVQSMWQEAFPQANITIENQEWAVYLSTLKPDAPDEDKPEVYRLGWCADYPDSNNWLNDVFNSASGSNYAKFNNPEYDAIVDEAATEADPARRQELYAEAERILIDQEAAIAPIYYYTYVQLHKPWLTPVINPVGGDPVAQWRIDVDAQQAALGN
jgi:oligopeptide transport system substrate-binding protein